MRMQNMNEGIIKDVIDLSDKISEVEDKLEKACLLIQGLNEEYFQKFNPEVKEDKWKIAWEFSRYAIYTDMIDDYVSAARNIIYKLRDIDEQILVAEKGMEIVESDNEIKTA